MSRNAAVLFVVAFLLAGVAWPVAVGAQDSTTTNDSVTTTSTDDDAIDTSAEKVKERVDGYKKRNAAKLTALAQKRLSARCEASQTKVKTYEDKVETVVAARMQVYNKLVERLNTVATAGASQGLDTAALKASLTTLETKVTELEAKLKTYREALNDTHTIKCTEDVTGFKSTLEAARTAHTDVITAIKDIRSFLKDTVHAQLMDVKKQLTKEVDSETDTDTNETTTPAPSPSPTPTPTTGGTE
jgi:chromosome segregation ATPase